MKYEIKHSSFSPDFFLLLIMLGTIITVSSSNWMLAWVGMELNMLSFLGWMCKSSVIKSRSLLSWSSGEVSSKYPANVEPYAKYFLAQAVGTSMFLLCPLVWGITLMLSHSTIFFLAGLFLKSGVAPFHQWFPSVCVNVSWEVNMMLMFWQKIAPLFLIGHMCLSLGGLLLLVGIVNLWFGVMGALGQTQLRSLFAYSSISHMGWMVCVMYFSKVGFFYYFLLYGLLIVPTLNIFRLVRLFALKDVSKVPLAVWYLFILGAVMLLSVSGMPPFTGFFMKAYSVYLMICSGNLALAVLFCILATVGLSYYVNIIFVTFLVRVLGDSKSEYAPNWLVSGINYWVHISGKSSLFFFFIWSVGLPFVVYLSF